MHFFRSIILILGAIPAALFAQPAEDSWERLGQIRTGQRIEVVTSRMKSVQGTFLGFTEQSISIKGSPDEVSIPRAEVVSIRNKETDHRKRNVLLGLAIGAAGGLAAGVIRGATYHEEGETGVFVMVATPIGAGIGAAVGAALPSGSATIYRVRTAKRP